MNEARIIIIDGFIQKYTRTKTIFDSQSEFLCTPAEQKICVSCSSCKYILIWKSLKCEVSLRHDEDEIPSSQEQQSHSYTAMMETCLSNIC